MRARGRFDGRRESAFYDESDPMFGVLTVREGEGDGDGNGDDDGKGKKGGEGEDDLDKLKTELAELKTAQEESKATIQRLNQESAGRRKKLEEFDGVDPDEFKRLKTEEEERKRKQAEEEGEYQKLLEAEKKKTREANLALEKQQHEYDMEKITAVLLSAAGALDAMPEAMEGGEKSQVVAIYGGQFEIVDGKPLHRSAMDDEGNKLDAKKFLESERSGAGKNLFKSKLKDGPGTGPGDTGGEGTVVTIKRDDPKRLTKREAAIKAGHSVKYE
jgi:chromosome segregation ATPase